MKTVTGKLVSTKPISVSNAAKYISRFTSSDNGASHAIGVYLQRASDSFNSSVHFHKKLKGSHTRSEEQLSEPLAIGADENPRGEKMKKSESQDKGKKNEEFELKDDVQLKTKQDKVVFNEVKVRESSEDKQNDEKNKKFGVNNGEIVKIEQSLPGVVEKKKKKKSGKEKGKNEETVWRGVDGEDTYEKVLDEGGEKKKEEIVEVEGGSMKRDKKRKRKMGEEEVMGEKGKKREDWKVDGGETIDQSESIGKKNGRKGEGFDQTKQEIMEDEGDMNGVSVQKRDKKKKKKSEVEEVEKSLGGEEGKKKKSREVDGGETIDLAEQSKKKKRRKIEGDGK